MVGEQAGNELAAGEISDAVLSGSTFHRCGRRGLNYGSGLPKMLKLGGLAGTARAGRFARSVGQVARRKYMRERKGWSIYDFSLTSRVDLDTAFFGNGGF